MKKYTKLKLKPNEAAIISDGTGVHLYAPVDGDAEGAALIVATIYMRMCEDPMFLEDMRTWLSRFEAAASATETVMQ